MKRFFVFLGVVFSTIGSAVSAQEVDSIAPLQKSSWGDAKTSGIVDYVPDVSLDTRFWCNRDFAEKSGRFEGDGLYLNIDGYISPHLSYSLQQRLASTYYGNSDGFNGTNWLTLTYEVGDFAFTAGKDGLLVGSFEYDTDDLDSYYDMNSMFYNMLDCWQWGISMEWYPAENHSLIFQTANSPFYNEDMNLFSYALGWRMESDIYESYWTANLWEYDSGRFVKNISLGNIFHIGDFSMNLDYQTRCAGNKSLVTDDFTVTALPAYEFGDWGRFFAKFGYEKVDGNVPYELAYEKGIEYVFYGAGFEFFPLKDCKDIRLHAAWSGNNFGENYINIGMKWRLDITSAAKYLLKK